MLGCSPTTPTTPMVSQVELLLLPAVHGSFVSVDDNTGHTTIEGIFDVRVLKGQGLHTQWINLELRQVPSLSRTQRVHRAAGEPIASWKAGERYLGCLGTKTIPFSIGLPDSTAAKGIKYQLMAALCFKEGKTWLTSGKCVVKTVVVPIILEHKLHRPPAIIITADENIVPPLTSVHSTSTSSDLDSPYGTGSSSDDDKTMADSDGGSHQEEESGLALGNPGSHLLDVDNELSPPVFRFIRPSSEIQIGGIGSTLSPPVSPAFSTRSGAHLPSRPDPRLLSAIPEDEDVLSPRNVLRGPVAGSAAFADPAAIVVRTANGTIEAGTLEGLVLLLVDDTIERRQLFEYRENFLKACDAFDVSREVYRILVRLFKETDENRNAEARTNTRFNIVAVLKAWVSMPDVRIEQAVLEDVRRWAGTVNTSKKMAELAAEIVVAVEARVTIKYTPSIDVCVDKQDWESMLISEVSPRELAKAMGRLEGEAILPADYSHHITRGYSEPVHKALEKHKKLERWIIQSILQHDMLETRVRVANFMIDVCEQCRLLRNFNSMAALTGALNSEPLRALRVTKEKLALANNETLAAVVALLDPHNEHSAYKAALTSSQEACIPWIDGHLQGLKSAFGTLFIQQEDCVLIKLSEYIKLGALVNNLYALPPQPKRSHAHSSPLSYLSHQLSGLPTDTPKLEAYFKLRANAVQAVGTDAGEELERVSQKALAAFSKREQSWLTSTVQVGSFELSKTVGSHW